MSCVPEIPTSFFGSTPQIPSDPISAITKEFTQDEFPHKINLSQSAPHDVQDYLSVLPSVRQAASRLYEQGSIHRYSPILGHVGLREAAVKSIIGDEIASNKASQIATCQTNSDMGAFDLVSKLAAHCCTARAKVYLPESMYSNYERVASKAGLECEAFNPYDSSHKHIDMSIYKKMLLAAQPGSAVVLYACGNDLTGNDPSEEEWTEIGKIIKERSLFPIFNAAYLGLTSGSVAQDAFPIRYFIGELDIETAICVSYDHSMGLYGEAVGCLLVYTSSETAASNCTAHLERIHGMEISSPSRFGASIVHLILTDTQLHRQWSSDLLQLVDRIRGLRRHLYDCLLDQAIPGQWNFLIRQKGIFGFLWLSSATIRELKETYHIYMAENSRISMAGLTEETTMYLAIAMADCVRNELLNDF